ncbi:hypothetical protein D917_04938 [Trichinella nativa]|uniref:DUF7164 domain-containing protein n=1 Tax=Trichinella nativa TaxID=6335 RepID=A0A1Y3EYR1_9BILA|nr:hypothetical protein D917_04938 [Trichinella nativa]
MLAAKKKHEEEEASKLREYEEQRRIQREREEEELKHEDSYYFIQERRRREREEEERILAERRREEEERRKQEEEDRKRRAEDDKRRKEEEKKKRQQMMAGLNASTGPNFQIAKKDKNTEKFDKFGNIVKAKAEMGLTKEQQEEQKRKFLAELVKPLSTQGLDIQGLRSKIKEFHQRICRLEADKYDLEKRGERQDYDLKELNERQRQISRNKALKKGLDPEEAANSRHPPKVPIASKYDRQIDRRSYSDRRHLFENPDALPHFPNTPVSLLILEKIHQDVKTNNTDDSDVDFTFTVQPSKEILSNGVLENSVPKEENEHDNDEDTSDVSESNDSPLKKKQQPIFHGSARPPLKWGRKENEELENLRRNLEPPKYIEQVKVEGARPPMEPIPVQMPDVYENGSVWHELPDQKMLPECYGDNYHGNIFLDNKTPIITGHGGYCTEYTTHRLHAVAKRLQLNHQKVHCPGSTWFGKSDVIIKLANLKLRPFFKNSAFGQWPEWWKPVSSMYAQELALNHLIKNFTTHFIQRDLLDVESCRESSIFNHLHVHTWHDDCEFQKFKFLNPIVANLTHGKPVFLRTDNAFPKLAKCMSVKEYCTHIAWNGVHRYFSSLAMTSPYFKD